MWHVPVAVWAYGLLRALAFAAPTWTEGGRIGLGVVVVLVLYMLMLRRSRRAWVALVALDAVSHLLLLVTWIDTADAALAIPIFAVASMVALLMPSTRRYVSTDRSPSAAPTETATTGV
jgi:hypothetical protein